MANRYVPGAPNSYFPTHKYHGIPVGRNIHPIAQAQVAWVGGDDSGRQALDVEILTAEHLWATFQVEAEDLLKIGGRWISDDQERNRRINAAYAKLWLADDRFQWAGLAAFASKQVGCGLLHSGDIIEKNRRQQKDIERTLGQGSAPGVQYGATLKQLTTEMAASEMCRRLGFGNMHLFLDVYPLHRFYMERGGQEFTDYLARRQNKRYAVHWEVDRKVLRFATPFREIREGFELIDSGQTVESVRRLAQHEQVNILQRILYDELVMHGLLALNQYAWASALPSGDYEEIQLTLSAQCRRKTGFSSLFSKEKFARLWVSDERMPFVLTAAERFDALLHGPERSAVEQSIQAIAHGGGIV